MTSTTLPELPATVMNHAISDSRRLVEGRLEVLRRLAESLEASRWLLAGNDAEAIARGAAHQAELCRLWSVLEDRLRRQTASPEPAPGDSASDPSARPTAEELEQEWIALRARIGYLTRVHSSLLRHMQRSLEVWARVAASCGPTYSAPAVPVPDFAASSTRTRVGE